MSKAQILEELPKLRPEERNELLDRLHELAEKDLLTGVAISPEEKAFLDREWQEFEKQPENGSSWREVAARIRGKPKT
jgi:hypothetical protein